MTRLRRTKEGFIRVWRICDNPQANDWNDKPEKIVVPYAIISESGNSYVVVRMGWGYGKQQQHTLPKSEFFFSPEDAQYAMTGRYSQCEERSDIQ